MDFIIRRANNQLSSDVTNALYVNCPTKSALDISDPDRPWLFRVEQGHPARCADAGGYKTLRIQVEEVMGELAASGETYHEDLIVPMPGTCRPIYKHAGFNSDMGYGSNIR